MPPRNSTAPPLRYVPEFDALRALAVFGVIATHYLTSPAIEWMGFVGVRLFFVLSGYLITRILLSAKTETASVLAIAKSFYARRFLRIFPIYYAAVLGACLTSASIRPYAPWLITYTQNIKFAIDGKYPVVAHLWSLAVEEQFYLAWPWIVLILDLVSLRRALFGLVILAPLTRALLFAQSANVVTTHVLVFACVDTLAAGGLVALAHESGKSLCLSNGQRALAVGAVVSLLAASFFASTAWTWHVLGESALAVCFADLIDRTAHADSAESQSALLNSRILRGIGKVSYGVYVIHFFVPNQIVRVWGHLHLPSPAPNLVISLISIPVTLALSALSWRYFEAPLNACKRFFPYAPRTRDGEASPTLAK